MSNSTTISFALRTKPGATKAGVDSVVKYVKEIYLAEANTFREPSLSELLKSIKGNTSWEYKYGVWKPPKITEHNSHDENTVWYSISFSLDCDPFSLMGRFIAGSWRHDCIREIGFSHCGDGNVSHFHARKIYDGEYYPDFNGSENDHVYYRWSMEFTYEG